MSDLAAQDLALERELSTRFQELQIRQDAQNSQNAEKARADSIVAAMDRVNAARSSAGDILSQLQRDEERINIARQSGSAGEIESLTRLGEVRKEAYSALLKQIELYERQSAIDPAGMTDKQREALEAMAPQIDSLRLQAEKLAAELDPLGDKIDQIFEDAFADAFTDFVTGTKTATEAFAAFGQSVIQQLAKIAAQQMAMQIFGMIGGKSSGGSWLGAALGLSFGTNPFSTQSMMLARQTFAEGGYTGSGGKYEPAGIVHAGEYVFTQDEVRAAGGPSVMDSLRKGLRGYANGGYVASPSAPVMSSSQQPINFTAINVLDPSLVGDYLSTDEGEKRLVNIMSKNKRAFA